MVENDKLRLANWVMGSGSGIDLGLIDPRATAEDIETLRHVIDHVPARVYIAALIGMTERFTFYGITAPLQNYMQSSVDSPLHPGGLGLGQSKATTIYYSFYTFLYITPLISAVVADCWLGRFRTIILSICIYMTGCLILVVTSLPASLREGAGVGGLVISLLLIGLGVGGLKATVTPFIVEQCTEAGPRVLVTKKGERVIADKALTIQYIYNCYFWMISIASLSPMATTYLEKGIGFSAAFLLPTCVFSLTAIIILLARDRFVKQTPKGNILVMAFRIFVAAAKGGFKLDAAKPEYMAEKTPHAVVSWSASFVDELKRGLLVTRLMVAYCVYFLCIGQMSNNLVSQAGQMVTNNFPNDALIAFTPVSCIILGPVVQKWLYPFLARRNIPFRPIARITVGFVLITTAMIYIVGIQSLIYHSAPCYEYPLTCPGSQNGTIPNQVSVWFQTPAYIAFAASEIFCEVTGLEYAYSRAPKDMRSLVQATCVLAAGFGTAIGAGIAQVATDPRLVMMYSALAGAMGVTTLLFGIIFRRYDSADGD